MKTYKEKVTEYYNNMLDVTQPDDKSFNDMSFRYYKKNHLQFLPTDKESKILDIGCGNGLFLNFLLNNGYKNIQGIDNNSINIEKCVNKGLNAICMDIFKFLNDVTEKYDCVVLLNILEHFPKEEGYKLLMLVNSILDTNGRIIITVPNMANPITAGRGRYADITHEIGFTQESIEFILKLTDYTSISVKPINIFVLKNGLYNIIGSIANKIFCVITKILFLLNGVKTIKVFSKNMIISASKYEK